MRLACAPAGDAGWFDRAWPLLAGIKDADRDLAWSEYCSGIAQLWVTTDGERIDAACITEASDDTLHVWLCGGRGVWRHLMDEIAEQAKGRFTRLTIEGRPGWARVLTGFERCGNAIERAL